MGTTRFYYLFLARLSDFVWVDEPTSKFTLISIFI